MGSDLARPACFDFALDVVGDPEAAELLAYVEELEQRLVELDCATTAPAHPRPAAAQQEQE